MRIYLEIDGERYANIEIDDRVLAAAPDRAKFLAFELEAHIAAMLDLKREKAD